MAKTDDDVVTPPGRLVAGSPAGAAEPAWVRARAVELLHSLDEFQVPIGRKQRLLFRLGQGWHRRRFAWLRPIVVGAFLMGIGGGAIASSGLTEWPAWVVRSYRKLLTTAPASQPAPPAPERPRGGKPARSEPEPVESPPPPAPRPAVTAHRAFAETRSRRPPADPPSDDALLLVDATRALRVERNPRRARALASRYLERQPGGALADEALAICIEAAIDLHDPDAAPLSARYLTRFPHGSFRGLAERTLTSRQ